MARQLAESLISIAHAYLELGAAGVGVLELANRLTSASLAIRKLPLLRYNAALVRYEFVFPDRFVIPIPLPSNDDHDAEETEKRLRELMEHFTYLTK